MGLGQLQVKHLLLKFLKGVENILKSVVMEVFQRLLLFFFLLLLSFCKEA